MLPIYYPISIKKQRITVSFLFFIISFFVVNPKIYASVLGPQSDYYRSQGLQEQQKGKYRSALNFYLKAISAGPNCPTLYNDVGVIYEQLGEPDRAEQYYLQVLKLDSNYLPAYSNLAYLYEGQGQTNKAVQYFVERLKRAPEDDPWKDKIREELYKLDPNLKAAAIKKDLEEKERRMQEEAEHEAQAEFTLAIKRSEQHYKRGQKYLDDKLYSKAVIEFDKALRVTPNNPKILKAKEQTQYAERMDEVNKRIDVATEKLKSGEVDSAKKEFQHILAIIPKETIQKSEN